MEYSDSTTSPPTFHKGSRVWTHGPSWWPVWGGCRVGGGEGAYEAGAWILVSLSSLLPDLFRCEQAPDAFAATPSPLWWTVAPQTASPDKPVLSWVTSGQVFGHAMRKGANIICQEKRKGTSGLKEWRGWISNEKIPHNEKPTPKWLHARTIKS